MLDLKNGMVYRIAKNADEPKIRGRAVVFSGWHQDPWDIRRAVVRILTDDGSAGEEWYVNAAIVIPLR